MTHAGSARDARRRPYVAVAVAVAAVLAASSGAMAAEPESVDGLLQFPNVRVVTAPQTNATAPQGGMRAYKDSAASPLRGPTTEELQAAAAASKTLRSTSGRDNDSPTFAAAGGGVGVVLDESSMQYSVVVRDADGSMKETCVTGPAAAEAAVKGSSPAKAALSREIQNVR